MVESFQVVQVTRYPPANAGDARNWVQYLGREDPLEKERVPHALWLANILRIILYP